MKLSELIKLLQHYEKKHGNAEVIVGEQHENKLEGYSNEYDIVDVEDFRCEWKAPDHPYFVAILVK